MRPLLDRRHTARVITGARLEVGRAGVDAMTALSKTVEIETKLIDIDDKGKDNETRVGVSEQRLAIAEAQIAALDARVRLLEEARGG